MTKNDGNRVSDSIVRIVVMASGEGSNLQALIDAIESGWIENMRIEALLCDKPGAHCIERAICHSIPSHICRLRKRQSVLLLSVGAMMRGLRQ